MEKSTTQTLRVKFHLGQNADISPEAASQVALRKLLWGSEGGARIYRSFAPKGRW